jgi:hypothetical protein
LIVTIIFEFVIIYIFIRKEFTELFLYSTLINSLTLPVATYGYQNILKNFYVIEMLVVVTESILIMILLKIKYPKAFFISFVANFVTASMSLLFFF